MPLIQIVLRKIKVSPAAKRFWKETSIIADDRGYSISLDGRPVKTPEGYPFIVKAERLASEIRDEWDAQEEKISPDTMPMYKFSVTAIDRVSTQRQAVVDELGAYGASDLLCYREDRDHRLADHQQNTWQSYLDWANQRFDVQLKVFGGIMPGDQDQHTKSKLKNAVDQFDDFQLSGLHSLVTVSGSLVLGLAATTDEFHLDQIIQAAFLDDLWQQKKWGYDEEAALRLNNYQQQLEDAHRFMNLIS